MSVKFNGHCNENCKFYCNTATPECGICKFPLSFISVELNADCKFAPKLKDPLEMTCGEHCVRFSNDFACYTVSEDAPIFHKGYDWKGKPFCSLCVGFKDKVQEKFEEVCYELYQRNGGFRKVIMEWLNEAEERFKNPWILNQEENDGKAI